MRRPTAALRSWAKGKLGADELRCTSICQVTHFSRLGKKVMQADTAKLRSTRSNATKVR